MDKPKFEASSKAVLVHVDEVASFWFGLLLLDTGKLVILSTMRAMALIATLALQLSIFTCGLDIHVDTFADNSGSNICQMQGQQGENAPASFDLGCQLHAAHVFTATEFNSVAIHAPISEKPFPSFVQLSLKDVLHAIDHPPSSLHS